MSLTRTTLPCLLLGFSLAGTPPAKAEENLYLAFGGEPGMGAVVDRFLWNLADDERISHFFIETNLERFREKLLEYFCMVAEGPCTYSGDTMQRTHANMGVGIADFNATVEALILAMEAEAVPVGAQNRLLKILAADFDGVVEVTSAAD